MYSETQSMTLEKPAWLIASANMFVSSMLSEATRHITMFIGMTFPFFGGLLGFFGGFALAPTTYFLPCIIWLILKKPTRFSFSWWMNWIFIVIGVALMILAPIGGLRSIILSAKTYKFYQ
ncbi:lysine histidine transporter 1-like [Salvia divinorum]|uniref:Lysine histidine transporter 1-like n=1 Tax=Salvia divinorum TaxID=28513 RepID=A0ABD1HPG8_SALDI